MPDNNNGRTVLIAMDHSEKSKYAFEWYLKNLRQEDDSVVVVHSVNQQELLGSPYYHSVPFAFDAEMLTTMINDEEDKIRKRLQELATIMINHKVKGSVRSIHASNAGQGIIYMASEIGASVIVMGSNGQGKIKRALFGSVSDYVLHHSEVPVIVCRHKNKSSHKSTSH